MTDPKYPQLEEEYKMILKMITDHDLLRPVEPTEHFVDKTIFRKRSVLEMSDAKTEWSVKFRLWQEDLEALQYGAREVNNAILALRFTAIMSRRDQ